MSDTPKKLFYQVRATDFPLEGGKLLVSAPFISDSYFDKTVILMVEHGQSGSLGFILNRALHVSLKNVMGYKAPQDFMLHNGGPLELNKLFFIHSYGDLITEAEYIGNGLFLGGNEKELEAMLFDGLLDEYRVQFFLGYAAWSSGQLEREMEEKSWVVAPFYRDCLHLRGTQLWRSVVERLGKGYAHWLEIPDKAYYN